MTLEALVVPEPSPPDSAELAAYKARVKKVGKRAKDTYGWCSAIDKILQELEVDGTPQTPVEVTIATSHGLSLTVKADPTGLYEKTVEEQVAHLIKTAGGYLNTYTPDGTMVGKLALSPDDVVGLSMKEPPTPSESGLIWRYSSNSGRVLHAFEEMRLADRGYSYSECTAVYGGLHDLTERSVRGTGYRCSKCERAIERQTT